MLLVELSQQKYLNLGACLLLVADKFGRKHLGVVKHHHIAVVEIIDYLFENTMFDFTCRFMYNHHTRLIAYGSRLGGNQFFGKLEFEL